MKKGYFIVFEGGEGVGKSTQIAKLQAYLEKKGRRVLVTREPGGSVIGKEIRKMLFSKVGDSITDLSEVFLFLSDRAQHVAEVIRPALKQGRIVICDRYYFSSIVYQGMLGKLGEKKVASLCQVAIDGCEPDSIILLDCPVDKSLKRVGQRQSGNRNDFAKKSFHQKVRKGFLSLAKKNQKKWKVIDASQPTNKVFESLVERLGL